MFGGWSVGETGEDLFQVGPWLNLVILTAGNQRCQNRSAVTSVAAGERSAGFMTLVSSALRNDLDVWQCVKDILDQLLSGVTEYERATSLELVRPTP